MYPGEIDKDPRLAKHNTYGAEDHKKFAAGFRELIEQYPLYKHAKLNPPPIQKHFSIEAATLRCCYCKGDRTIRATQSHVFRVPFFQAHPQITPIGFAQKPKRETPLHGASQWISFRLFVQSPARITSRTL